MNPAPKMCVLYGVVLLVLRLVVISDGVTSQTVTCTQDWTGYGNHCYRFISHLRISWENAQNECQNQDSNLVTIETDDENTWLKSLFSQEYPWIGANNHSNDGDWRWVVDNSAVTFTDWTPGEPNNHGGNEDCVHFYRSMQWNDAPCKTNATFICEKGVTPKTVTCQQNWTRYGNHCYRFISHLRMSWENAQNECQNQDSNLVTIETEDENTWLKSLFSQEYPWIGANDHSKDGDWRWVADNSALTLTDWKPGEPNDFGGNQDCAYYFVNTQWDDENCGFNTTFICEKVVAVHIPCTEDHVNAAAVGIGIGFGVVILALVIVIIVLARKLQSMSHKDTTRSTTMTDISLPNTGQERRTDETYDGNYEQLGDRDVPHIYETT